MEIPDNWHTLAPVDERRAALHDLAAEGRLLADRLIASQASTQQLLAATKSLRELVASLPERGLDAPIYDQAHIDTFADQSPVIGLSNMAAPPAVLQMSEGVVDGVVSFGVVYEGPPGHVHGGWISAVFDEVLGMVQATTKKPGMTGRLEVSYRRPTPLNTPIHFRGVVDRVEGRKIFTSARSYNPITDETYAESTGLFISIEFDRFTSPTRPDGLGHTKYVQEAIAKSTPENES
jgi:Thioesterase superfamily